MNGNFFIGKAIDTLKENTIAFWRPDQKAFASRKELLMTVHELITRNGLRPYLVHTLEALSTTSDYWGDAYYFYVVNKSNIVGRLSPKDQDFANKISHDLGEEYDRQGFANEEAN